MSKIINFARQQVGLPYVFGTSVPKLTMLLIELFAQNSKEFKP